MSLFVELYKVNSGQCDKISLRQILIEAGETPDDADKKLAEIAKEQLGPPEDWPEEALSYELVVADFKGEDITARLIEETKQFRLYPPIGGSAAASLFYWRNLPISWHYILRLVPDFEVDFPVPELPDHAKRWLMGSERTDYMWSVALLEAYIYAEALKKIRSGTGPDSCHSVRWRPPIARSLAIRKYLQVWLWSKTGMFSEEQTSEYGVGYCYMRDAARIGSLACMRYLHDNGCPPNAAYTLAAAEAGSLECMIYAGEKGHPLWDGCTRAAASVGSLECLKYAREKGCQWTVSCTRAAARAGSLDCLKYAHENGCPWDITCTRGAAWADSLGCFKYAHENGCPWDYTCTDAAEVDSLECLEYAHENGCPWQHTCTLIAANRGSLDCLKYADENACEILRDCTYAAAVAGRLECLKYLHRNGCDWDERCLEAAVQQRQPRCAKYVVREVYRTYGPGNWMRDTIGYHSSTDDSSSDDS
jgi:hypothetical protein